MRLESKSKAGAYHFILIKVNLISIIITMPKRTIRYKRFDNQEDI